MSGHIPEFTIGIEEEYLLVDPVTRDLASAPPDSLLAKCEKAYPGQLKPEFLKSQVEANTKVWQTVAEARDDLATLRRAVIKAAHEHGLAPIAASTHPFTEWQQQPHTDKERYNVLAEDLQSVARRLVICGMHVHVGINDDELRIDLLGQVSYFLPHLLALSTSSPFWRGENSGLMSYRLSVFNELPRTGLPNHFTSYSEYKRHIDMLIRAGVIEDATKLWWDIRPSAAFPTLEMRITDVCTHIDDAAAIAALFQCVLRMLYRLKLGNQRWRQYASLLINENRWRAQRYGMDQGLVDFGKGEIVDFNDLLEELLEITFKDADALGCHDQMAHLRTMQKRGSSAHQQLAIYQQSIDNGKDKRHALEDVVDMLIKETAEGL